MMSGSLPRRALLQGAAALAVSGCAPLPRAGALYRPTLAPIRASLDRMFDITVCLRPFRAAGPRLETERVGDKLVVHNYGHGGSGWSLSWGSADVAVRLAMAASPSEIAVIGCGAIGLTSAIMAQRAGAKVTIYACATCWPQTRSVPRHRLVDAGLPHRARQRRRPGLRRPLGADGALLV